MSAINAFVDMFLHVDQHLGELLRFAGPWTYVILFAVIFAETGLVVTPFLPGDSLLFAIGALCHVGDLNVWVICASLIVAAILGDTVNYAVGAYIGPRVFEYKDSRIFRKEYLERTQRFYDRHGGKTIVLARFVPIVRTFAPFVAGVGKMNYGRFIAYNVIGGIAWVLIFVLAGYAFGNIPVVKKNFTIVIFGIIGVSVLPIVIETYNAWRAARKNPVTVEGAILTMATAAPEAFIEDEDEKIARDAAAAKKAQQGGKKKKK